MFARAITQAIKRAVTYIYIHTHTPTHMILWTYGGGGVDGVERVIFISYTAGESGKRKKKKMIFIYEKKKIVSILYIYIFLFRIS